MAAHVKSHESVVYNEFDSNAAAWLDELVSQDLINPGSVDSRSILEMTADDLRGRTQVHLFAGIGVWSYAARLAGWPDDRPLWTASCPCQPFSTAGKRKGTSDERHLWPVVADLVRECRPPIVVGEQVSGPEVIGRNSPAGVPHLWEREAIAGFLRELQGVAPERMHRVPEDCRTHSEAVKPRENADAAQGVARREARVGVGEYCQASGEDEGTSVQSGRFGDSGPYRRRHLRNDRHPIRPDDAPGVECTIPRSDCSRGGLHDQERPCGSICLECNGEHLGSTENCGDSCRDYEDAAGEGEIERLIESLSREIQGADGPVWLDTVFDDLEREGYTCGAISVPACSVGSPHIRQRLYWCAVADADDARLEGWRQSERERADERPAGPGGVALGLADALHPERGAVHVNGQDGRDGADAGRQEAHGLSGTCGEVCGMADDESIGRREERSHGLRVRSGNSAQGVATGSGYGSSDMRPRPTDGFWRDADWLACRDGKWRPVEPGTQPLAHGAPARVGRLRGYGNAIVAPLAAEFLGTVLDVLDGRSASDAGDLI